MSIKLLQKGKFTQNWNKEFSNNKIQCSTQLFFLDFIYFIFVGYKIIYHSAAHIYKIVYTYLQS